MGTVNDDTGDPAMNSYNHYAFGSVMAGVYCYAAGIDTAPATPGFRHIVLDPRLDSRLDQARGEYDSVYGKIVSDWSGTPAGPFSLKEAIPANTTADVYLPAIAKCATHGRRKSRQAIPRTLGALVPAGGGKSKALWARLRSLGSNPHYAQPASPSFQ